MLTTNEIEDLKSYCRSIAKDLYEDLTQEVLIILLTKYAQHPNKIALAKRVAYNQYYNRSSDFSKKYRPKQVCEHTYFLTLEQTETPEQHEKILNFKPKTKREMFIHEIYLEYIEIGSVRKLSDLTGIPRVTIHKALKRFEELCKKL